MSDNNSPLHSEEGPTDAKDETFSKTRRSVLKGTAALGAGALISDTVVAADGQHWSVIGPNSERTAVVSQPNEEDQLLLSIHRNGRTVVEPSPLGINTGGTGYVTGLSFVDRTNDTVTENYRTTTGKRLRHRHRGNQTTLTFEKDGQQIHLDVRVAAQGVGYRYRFPGDGEITITGEENGFRVPSGANGWTQPWRGSQAFSAAYENLYRQISPTDASGEYAFGTTFEVNDKDWVLFSEADISGRYTASHLTTSADDTLFSVIFPDDLSSGTINSIRPLRTPWRVAIVGNLSTITESDLIQSLSPRSTVDDTSWINPGRVDWSWWSQGRVDSFETQKKYVDYASEHGWEFTLVDVGWDVEWMPDLVDYANARGVEIILWNRWNDGHSDINPGGPPGLNNPEKREELLSRWKDWGVAGIKIDFMNSDSQKRMEFYDEILEATAEKELMINFHGASLPKGRRRTWPHEMTREAIKGAEYYKFGEITPTHNAILPFTRNVVGAMDYTPTTFSASDQDPKTTPGHELALSVVFESGWQHLADDIDMYEEWPKAERFLDNIEPAWEETQLIDGRPGEEATIARRKDNEWFVGSIVAGAGREIEVLFDFLDSNRPYIAEVTKDVEGKRELEFEHHGVRRGDTVSVSVPENGGFTIRLVPAPKIDPVISVEQSEETLMTTLTNYARSSRTNIEFSLSLPDELVIESRSNTSVQLLRSGESATAAWTLSGNTKPSTYEGSVVVEFNGPGGQNSIEWPIEYFVPLNPLPEGWKTFTSTEARFGTSDEQGTLAINANGTDVWIGSDEYGALYQPDKHLRSEGSATVEVVSQEDTNRYAKAGLMAANDITAAGKSAPDVTMFVTPGDGFHMEWDSDGDGYIDSFVEAGTATYPCKVRLKRERTTFTGSYSTDDGATWTELNTVDLPAAAAEQDIGIFVTSHRQNTLGFAEFDEFSVEN